MTIAQRIILEVPGVPRPQPRPRVTKTGHAFNPTTAGLTAWKAQLRIAARGQAPASPWRQAVRVDVEAYFPRPRWLLGVMAGEALPMLERPDRDNLDKTILDTLTGLGYWADDSQVFAGRLAKFYAREDCGPGAIVTVTFIRLEPAYWEAATAHAVGVEMKREGRGGRGMGNRARGAKGAMGAIVAASGGSAVPARGSRILNDQMSIEQLAGEIAKGRKVRV